MNDHHADAHQAGDGAFDLPPDLQAWEAKLAELRPNAGRLERERVAYLAGRAAAMSGTQHRTRLERWGWPAATAAFAAMSAALLAALLQRPQPTVVERVVYLPGPAREVIVHQEKPSPPAAPEKTAAADPQLVQRISTETKFMEDAEFISVALAQYRFFDHLLSEGPYVPTQPSLSSQENVYPLNRAIWSARSWNELLDELAPARGTSSAPGRRAGQSSGVES